MSKNICPICHETQYTETDKKYLELYNQCSCCDQRSWEIGELSDQDFQAREVIALKACNG